MPYSQKANRPDIRSVSLKSLQTPPRDTQSPDSPKQSHDTVHHPKPSRELKQILFCSAPLIIALVVATYYDKTHHWVIPFAKWLFKLGT